MRKSIAWMAAAAIASLSAFPAAAQSPAIVGNDTPCESVSGAITAVFPENSDKDRAFYDDLITRFNALYPTIEVDLQVVPWGDVHQRVDTLIATNQPPDVLALNTYANYAAEDLLNPISQVMSSAAIATFDPNMLADAQRDGIQYAVPWVASVSMLAYNTSILEQAGITEAPRTWADLTDATIKVRDSGQIGYTIRGGTVDEAFSMVLFGNGGNWKTDGAWTIDTPEAIEALTYLRDLGQLDGTGNPGATDQEMRQVFSQGRLGMIMGASFFPAVIGDLNPDLEYELALYPSADESIPPVTFAIQDYAMSFRTANDPRLGGCFLEFLFDAENLVPYQTALGGLPGTIPAQQAMAEGDPQMAEFMEMLRTAHFYPDSDPRWPAVQAEARQNLPLVLDGLADPAETLHALQATATEER